MPKLPALPPAVPPFPLNPVILVLAFSQLIPSSVGAQGYFLKDFQYFRPIVADLRTSQNHVRIYRAGEVPFSNSTSQGDHWFVDGSFGERFSLLGYSFSTPDQEPFRNPGMSLFVDGAAHVLIDLNTESRDVINADYRIALGVALRVPFAPFLAFQYRFIHESSHIGDEYTLFASLQPGFRRYNVSYEANDLYAAIDHRASQVRSGLAQPFISYMRAFAGFRRLNTDRHDGFTGLFEPASPVLLAAQQEYHVGGELYFRGWQPPEQRADSGWWSRLFAFQNWFIATDLKRENRYDSQEPERTWSVNVVLGLIFGESLGVTGERTTRWEISYYNGVNPNGQFRQDKLSYLGFAFVIDF